MREKKRKNFLFFGKFPFKENSEKLHFGVGGGGGGGRGRGVLP